ncbi:hypothetical protein [Microbacterium sp. SL75]|uniref:hypothetical protein n=1 Tax=Microbacterium sp. SL75 TaxID=2995140 RepID=UPI00226EC1FA|nr:hypothetical protein [Microbacterium sp. SL75]WAC67814.1 hypothetical protein OVA17_09315 [Microbacterium sp. SL75]
MPAASPPDRPPRAEEGPTGRWKIARACVVHVPQEAQDAAVAAIREALRRAHLHPAPERASAAKTAQTGESLDVWERGDVVSEALLDNTGLSLFVSRIGPLSLKAVVVVTSRPEGRRWRIIVSMVVGSQLSDEISREVDAAIDALVAGGIRVDGPGWMRVADLTRDTLAHPKTAREHGIRA